MTASLTRDEFDRASAAIRAAGLSRSEALRLLVLNADLPQMQRIGLDPAASEAYAKLAPLQSNLNQIAAWFNKVEPQQISKEIAATISKNITATYKLVKALRHDLLEITS